MTEVLFILLCTCVLLLAGMTWVLMGAVNRNKELERELALKDAQIKGAKSALTEVLVREDQEVQDMSAALEMLLAEPQTPLRKAPNVQEDHEVR